MMAFGCVSTSRAEECIPPAPIRVICVTVCVLDGMAGSRGGQPYEACYPLSWGVLGLSLAAPPPAPMPLIWGV